MSLCKLRGEKRFHGAEQRIDRLLLNCVRGVPRKPPVVEVFGHDDLAVAAESAKKDDKFLPPPLAGRSRAADLVTQGEAKARDQLDILSRNAGLLGEFPEGDVRDYAERILAERLAR